MNKNRVFNFRINNEDYVLVKRIAVKQDLTVSGYIRNCVVNSLKIEKGKAV